MKQSITYNHFVGYECLEDIQNDTVELCLITCGMEDCAPLHSYDGVRDLFILHFISDGIGYVEDKGELISLSEGEVFLIEPGRHVHYYADADRPWSYMWVGFRGIKASAYLQYAGYNSDNRFGQMENIARVQSYIRQIITNRAYTYSNELRRNSALLQILALLIDSSGHPVRFRHELPRQHYIELAKKYVEDNYKHEVKVSDIAQRIGIDRSYLTQLFKEVLHISPQEYILYYRLDRAALLLYDPTMKISAIAHEVGYQDVASFSRTFKRVKGMTPSDYRRQLIAECS